MSVTLGIYRHFKGGRYYALRVATHTEDGSENVVYESLETKKSWIRPVDMWAETTDRWPDKVVRPRFVLESELPKEVLDSFKEAP